MWGEKIKKSLTVFLLMIGLSSYILPQKNIVFAQTSVNVYCNPGLLCTLASGNIQCGYRDFYEGICKPSNTNTDNIGTCSFGNEKGICVIPTPTLTTDIQGPAPIQQTNSGTSLDQPVPIGGPTWTPTPAPTKLDDLTITANLHISKCGLAETGYQCCYPNLKSDTASFVGDFLNNFGALWDTVKTFIGDNINSMLQIGTADLKNAITSGGNIPNLCPRSEEGPRKERFVQLGQNDQQKWLDQNENYDGQNENDSLKKQELENYASLLYGETVPSLGERNFSDNDGIVGKILKSTTIPSDGISHENSNYACFCVNTENEVDKTPEYFLNLQENKVSKINQGSYIIKNSSSVSSEGKQVAGAVLEARTQDSSSFDPFDISANKFCRNIGNATEEEKCKTCVKSSNGGGAWTALGCIPANFNGALETLFPIIISFAGLISLGCIIYASFLLQTSMGEPEKIGKAQELMTSCITGLIMIIFSIFILRVIGFDILRLPGFGDEASSQNTDSSINTFPTPTTGQGLMVDSPT
jgi:hypothetical protein